MPTSSSQALIGGLVGAGLALSAVLIWAIKLVFRRTGEERTERGFRIGQLASPAAVSLGHGTNECSAPTRRTLCAGTCSRWCSTSPERAT